MVVKLKRLDQSASPSRANKRGTEHHVGHDAMNRGVSPSLFGTHAWAILFSVADSLDETVRTHRDGTEHVLTHRVGTEQVMRAAAMKQCIAFCAQLCAMLPCKHCREYSSALIANAPHWWGRNTCVEFVYWLRLAVNRKLMRQQLAKCDGRETEEMEKERARIYVWWREYVPHLKRVRIVTTTSVEGVRALLYTLWWTCQSNVVRNLTPSFCTFYKKIAPSTRIQHLLHLLAHVLKKWNDEANSARNEEERASALDRYMSQCVNDWITAEEQSDDEEEESRVEIATYWTRPITEDL